VAAGLTLLDQAIAGMPAGSKVLPGSELFRLYDTFGLPLDLAQDVADERGIGLDTQGFEVELQAQRARAQASWKGSKKDEAKGAWHELAAHYRTLFDGFERSTLEGVKVVALLGPGGEPVSVLTEGQTGEVLLEATPFYGEAGGQVGDSGWIVSGTARVRVDDTYRPAAGLVASRVTVEAGRLATGDYVTAEIDVLRRQSIKRNHTATHLLHAALREVVGTHVKQAGSLVAPDRLRFDFSHFAGVTDRALADIESLVNRRILENTGIVTEQLPIEDALKSGAMALFGEKYGETVRVVTIGSFSKELCGGTHCAGTGEIGLFMLTNERGVASGTRRVEALTGQGSLEKSRSDHHILQRMEELLSVPRSEVLAEFGRRLEAARARERDAQRQHASAMGDDLARRAASPEIVSGIKLLAARVDGLASQDARVLADNLRRSLGSGIVILGRAEGDKASILVAVTDDLKARIGAGDLVKELARIIGGGGGGRSDLAEAGRQGSLASRRGSARRTRCDCPPRRGDGLRHEAGARAILATFALAVSIVPAFCEELLYYVKDGQVVVTNTPSRRDVKPVPHGIGRNRAARLAAAGDAVRPVHRHGGARERGRPVSRQGRRPRRVGVQCEGGLGERRAGAHAADAHDGGEVRRHQSPRSVSELERRGEASARAARQLRRQRDVGAGGVQRRSRSGEALRRRSRLRRDPGLREEGPGVDGAHTAQA
jgi:alanyl-tRNA synthetase